jgi:hypothetical protein
MNVNLTTEGQWNEMVNVLLTDAQKQLLTSNKASDADARQEVVKYIQDNRKKAITDANTLTALTAEYTKLKPTMNDGDIYQLIACDVSLSDDLKVISSILNCRINGEHKQVRG